MNAEPFVRSNTARAGGPLSAHDEDDQAAATAIDTNPSAWERALIKELDAPRLSGETYRTHYERKERELVAAFAVLALREAQALHDRLSTPRADDALAIRFARLVPDRRARLLAFLVSSPRRLARIGIPTDPSKEP
jgi:hypothetical protein